MRSFFTVALVLALSLVVQSQETVTATVSPTPTGSPTITPTADPAPLAPLPVPPVGPLPALGIMAIAITAIGATIAVALFSYYKGRRDEHAAAAVPISERDANSRRAYMAAVEGVHSQFMKEIAVGNVVHMNPVGGGGPARAPAASPGVHGV